MGIFSSFLSRDQDYLPEETAAAGNPAKVIKEGITWDSERFME